MSNDKTIAIARVNDELRKTFQGGSVCITPGIQALREDLRQRVFDAVRSFGDFNEDNDPHGEHDCASLEVEGVRLIWKIDYYDPSFRYLSDDAADPKITRRVLTIMRAEEY